jgi:hypothetical protein
MPQQVVGVSTCFCFVCDDVTADATADATTIVGSGAARVVDMASSGSARRGSDISAVDGVDGGLRSGCSGAVVEDAIPPKAHELQRSQQVAHSFFLRWKHVDSQLPLQAIAVPNRLTKKMLTALHRLLSMWM